jgi:hypothetical protein
LSLVPLFALATTVQDVPSQRSTSVLATLFDPDPYPTAHPSVVVRASTPTITLCTMAEPSVDATTVHDAPSWCSIRGCWAWSVGSNRCLTAHASVDEVADTSSSPPEPEIAGCGAAVHAAAHARWTAGRATPIDVPPITSAAAAIDTHAALRRPMVRLPSFTGGPRR